MSGPTNRESDKFMLRLPEGMRERIKAAAEANKRSMNAEIVSRLEDSLDGSQTVGSLSINIDLAKVDQAEMRAKLTNLMQYMQELESTFTMHPLKVTNADEDDS